MKITFGICTYNRKDILEKSARSLKEIDGYDSINIRIYDDHSTEYDEEYLRKLFPEAKTIYVQKKNVGADANIAYMYQDFLGSGDDYFFNADSDLIYRRDILKIIKVLITKSEGFFSLFNTDTHETIASLPRFFVEKKNVGSAGCIISRKLVDMIDKEARSKNVRFDFCFCEVLKNNNIRILATKNSYVQHIGVNGYNSSGISFDYGKNFKCDSITNAQIIEATFEAYMSRIYNFKKKKSWKGYYMIFLFPRSVLRYLKRKYR